MTWTITFIVMTLLQHLTSLTSLRYQVPSYIRTYFYLFYLYSNAHCNDYFAVTCIVMKQVSDLNQVRLMLLTEVTIKMISMSVSMPIYGNKMSSYNFIQLHCTSSLTIGGGGLQIALGVVCYAPGQAEARHLGTGKYLTLAENNTCTKSLMSYIDYKYSMIICKFKLSIPMVYTAAEKG